MSTRGAPFVAQFLGAALCACGAAAADAPPVAGDADRLVALLVADTKDPDIGPSVELDAAQVRRTLEQGVPSTRLSLSLLAGDGVTPDAVLAAVRALAVRPADSLLVYYAGHGAWADAGPYLRLAGGKTLPRADLAAAMRARGARLSILLTDCCSTYVGETMLYAPPRIDPDTYRDLFFRHRGFVDVTAAQRGQVAVGDTQLGGVFTQTLTGLLTTGDRTGLDADRDGIVTWTEAVAELRRGTRQVLTMLHPRGLTVRGKTVAGQTPTVFGELARPAPGPIPKSAKRLGVRTEATGGVGARVVEVLPSTPAAWMGVRVGEIVVELRLLGVGPDEDVRAVRTPAELVDALQAAGSSSLAIVVLRDPASKDASGAPASREVPVRLGP